MSVVIIRTEKCMIDTFQVLKVKLKLRKEPHLIFASGPLSKKTIRLLKMRFDSRNSEGDLHVRKMF